MQYPSTSHCYIVLLQDASTHFFFFFYWRYNPLWVLAVSVILFHSVLSLHNYLHSLIPILCISSSKSSIQLFFGLPLILLPIGFQSNTHLGFSFHPSTSRDLAKPFFCYTSTHLAVQIMQTTIQPSSFHPVFHMPSSMCSEVPTLILAVSNFLILLPEKQLKIFFNNNMFYYVIRNVQCRPVKLKPRTNCI
jgi:hypothetical protein